MILKSERKNVSLNIEDVLIEKLEKHGTDNYPNECGGFLVGYYSDDLMSLQITDFILPKKQKGSPTVFERSADGLKQIFHQLFFLKNHYYVGEWHTHPNGSSMYSQTDLNAMMQIATSLDVNIENPVLLILNICNTGSEEFSIYLYDNNELIKYE